MCLGVVKDSLDGGGRPAKSSPIHDGAVIIAGERIPLARVLSPAWTR